MSKEGREVYLTGTLPKPQYVLLAEKQPVLLPKPPAQTSAPCVHMLKEDDKVPLFLVKLWRILHDTNYQNVVFWDETGFSFHIIDPHSFCRNVLPQYFKHNNLNSLIRQLNMYGFRKMTPIEKSGLAQAESDQDHIEFSHPFFVRGHPELLANIKRKTPTSRSNDSSTMTVPSKDLSLLVDEVRQLREKQRAMESKMDQLVKENESVWQQLSHIRNQHIKQQHVVNKLVQFLVALVRPAQKCIGKRNLLAIDETRSKRARVDSPSAQSNQQPPSNLAEIIDRLQREIFESGSSQVFQNLVAPQCIQGPIIADITDEPEIPHAESSTSGQTAGMQSLQAKSYLPGLPANPALTSSEVPQSPAVTFSPSLDRQISEELAGYLSGQEQAIDNCRDLLGTCWDLLTDDCDPNAEQQQQLMLESSDPLLALSDVPKTPDLLTPLASPLHNVENN